MTATSTPTTWGPPPAVKTGRSPGARAAFIDALKANPGQWARYPSANASDFRAAGCEAAQRTENGTVCVYIRWPA